MLLLELLETTLLSFQWFLLVIRKIYVLKENETFVVVFLYHHNHLLSEDYKRKFNQLRNDKNEQTYATRTVAKGITLHSSSWITVSSAN